MSDPLTSTVPPTPTERDHAAQEEIEASRQVPSRDAPSTQASSAKVADTEHDAAVVAGDDAIGLVEQADDEARMPPGPPPLPADAGTPVVPEATVTAAPGPGGGEVEVECPQCALVVVGDQPRPTAAWFCPRCDYPLFWAAPPPKQAPSARARHRLPGTGGRSVVGAEACWYCGEMNEPGAGECFRCAATLPKPVAPVPEVMAEVETTAVPLPVPFPTVTWPFVAAGLLAGLSAGISATLWWVGIG